MEHTSNSELDGIRVGSVPRVIPLVSLPEGSERKHGGPGGRRSGGVIYGLPVVHGPYSLRRIQTNSKASTAAAMPIRIAARWRGTSVAETNGEPSAGGRGGSPPADGI